MTQDELMDAQLPEEPPVIDDPVPDALTAVVRSLEDDVATDDAPAPAVLSEPDASTALAQETPRTDGAEEPALESQPEAVQAEQPAVGVAEAEDEAGQSEGDGQGAEGPAAELTPEESGESEAGAGGDSELAVMPDQGLERPATRVAWWPFIVYGVLWIGLTATSYLLLTSAQVDIPAFRQDAYPYLVLAGLVLTLLGPLIALAVWLFAWFKAAKTERGGMFTTALVRGAVATFLGVVVWWGVLVLIDALRLGLV